MTELKSWLRDNQTLVYFLVAQAIAIGAVGVSVITYMVRLETRVSIMETRGAAYTAGRLTTIDERLTKLESLSVSNKQSIDRIVDVMTKRLNINP
jgi:exopolysaccharide biosynthesis protein